MSDAMTFSIIDGMSTVLQNLNSVERFIANLGFPVFMTLIMIYGVYLACKTSSKIIKFFFTRFDAEKEARIKEIKDDEERLLKQSEAFQQREERLHDALVKATAELNAVKLELANKEGQLQQFLAEKDKDTDKPSQH